MSNRDTMLYVEKTVSVFIITNYDIFLKNKTCGKPPSIMIYYLKRRLKKCLTFGKTY